MTSFLNLPTVFHIAHYNSGAKWVANILESCVPNRIMPPRIEVAQFLGQQVIPGMVYPTLYVTRDEFESVEVPDNHIKFITMRDLRDTIVSWYFSASKTHDEMPNLAQTRQTFHAETREIGLQTAIREQGQMIAAFQLSWTNSNAMIVRYEDLLSDELVYFRRIIRNAQFPISDKSLTSIVRRFSHKRNKDLSSTDRHWSNYLKGDLLEEFKAYFDDILIATGYEKTKDWGLDLLPQQVAGVELDKNSQRTKTCWCGHTKFEPFSPHYQRCMNCGTLVHKYQQIPVDTPETISTPDAKTSSKEKDYSLLKLQTRQYLSRKDTLTKFKICLNYLEPDAKILQINEETGAFVMLLRQAGFKAAGLNPLPLSRNRMDFHQHTLKIPMLYGSLASHNIRENSLDAIILTDILGTTIDPVELLQHCNRWLKPDGKLIIQEYILEDDRSYTAMQRQGSAALQPLMLNENQHIFTQVTINRFLREAGYPETVKMYLPRHSLTLREKYVDIHLSKTCVIASRVAFDYHPASEEALYENEAGYIIHALLDIYRDLALAYETLEDERELWLKQIEKLTTASPEVFLQTHTIRTGAGWYGGEIQNHRKFAWVGNDAELIIHEPVGQQYHMFMDIEPGPSAPADGLSLIVTQPDETVIQRLLVKSRQKIFLTLPVEPERKNVFILQVKNSGQESDDNLRILNYRVFAMGPYKSAQDEPMYTLQGAQDILVLGAGWYAIEAENGRSFRWANNNVEIIVYNASGRFNRIAVDIQGGPSLKHGVFKIDVVDAHGKVVDSAKIPGKTTQYFVLPIVAHQDNHFRLRVHSGGLTIQNDSRILNFRVFGIGWAQK